MPPELNPGANPKSSKLCTRAQSIEGVYLMGESPRTRKSDETENQFRDLVSNLNSARAIHRRALEVQREAYKILADAPGTADGCLALRKANVELFEAIEVCDKAL